MGVFRKIFPDFNNVKKKERKKQQRTQHKAKRDNIVSLFVLVAQEKGKSEDNNHLDVLYCIVLCFVFLSLTTNLLLRLLQINAKKEK